MKYLFFAFFLLVSCGKKNKMEIGLAKKSWNKNENLEYTIINNDTQIRYYYTSLDCYTNEYWHEIIADVHQPLLKQNRVDKIHPNEKVVVTIPISKLFLSDKQLNFKKFRIKIVSGASAYNFNTKSYSTSFRVVTN